MTAYTLSSVVRPTAPAHVAGRFEWIDVARGFGIVLVVTGHALDGLLSARLISVDSPYWMAHQCIYSFHMPLFLLLSGLFAERYITGTRSGHLSKTLSRLVYPYLLWTVISNAVIVSVGNLVNVPVRPDWMVFVRALWSPPSQFWFLYALFLIQVIYIILARHAGLRTLLVVFVVLRFLPVVLPLPELLKMTCTYGLFYALGALAGKPLLERARSLSIGQAIGLAMACLVVWAIATYAALAAGQGYLDPAMIPASLAGTACVICIALAWPRRLEAAPRYLGSISMPIYLAHVIFAAGTRIVLAKFLGIEEPAALLPLLIASGVFGPLLMWEIAERLQVSRLIGLK